MAITWNLNKESKTGGVKNICIYKSWRRHYRHLYHYGYEILHISFMNNADNSVLFIIILLSNLSIAVEKLKAPFMFWTIETGFER